MEQWTHYWQQTSALNSFAEGQSALGYFGELQNCWQQQLMTLPDDAKLLDAGSGNGALAILCYQYGLSRHFQWNIHAVDAADITPLSKSYAEPTINSALSHIQFLGNTFLESLPYENHTFDLVCSQFALEYAKLEYALPECMRVLKTNGRLVAMMHHEESAIVADSRCGLAVLDLFLTQSDVFAWIKTLLQRASALILQGISVKSDSEFNTLNQALLQQFGVLQRYFSDNATAVWCQQFMARLVPFLYELSPSSPGLFEHHVQQLALYRLRLVDQLNAAITDERQQQIDRILAHYPVSVTWQDVIINQQHFGRLLVVQKLATL